MSVVEALLSHVVDYAGLFPPASLDMESAVRNYQRYLHGDYAWMLGNFVVPASRLEEFAQALDQARGGEQGPPWNLNVLCTLDELRSEMKVIDDFRPKNAFLAAFEARAIHATAAKNILNLLIPSRMRYIEFAPEKAETVLPMLLRYGARAKIRAGGLTADAIPPPKTIARFLQACNRHRVPFKATAGLHHAIRGTRQLTYELGSPAAPMHGFLNVLFAAALVQLGAAEEAVVKTLLEDDPTEFRLDEEDEDKLGWHENRLTFEQAVRLRSDFAISFGSCSFMEPVEELKAMGWL